MSYVLERIAETKAFAALRDEWDDLLASSVADCVFLTWEWLFTWWRHLGDGRELFLLVVRENGRLVGIAPLARTPRRAGWLTGSRLEFLGNGTVGSDYLDVIARRGKEKGVADAVADFLAAQGLMLHLVRIRQGSVAAQVGAVLGLSGWSGWQTAVDVCPFVSLAGHSWSSYMDTLGSMHRYTVRRKSRAAAIDCGFQRARTEAERREALEILIELHERRWQGTSAVFRRPELVAFHHEFTRLALDRDWLRLYVLRLDGRPAAALYGLRRGRVFSFYQSGFDPEHQRRSLGLVAMAFSIEQAIAEGAEEYDLLHGAEPYKLHWARETRELVRLDLFPPRIVGSLWRQAFVVGRSARRMVRRMVPPRVLDWIRAGVP